GVIDWLTWFQDEAQRTNDYGLLDIMEIGIKPAFQRIDAAVEGAPSGRISALQVADESVNFSANIMID
ncbi:hypothetical protein, partial [Agrobacterium salinitolerans]